MIKYKCMMYMEEMKWIDKHKCTSRMVYIIAYIMYNQWCVPQRLFDILGKYCFYCWLCIPFLKSMDGAEVHTYIYPSLLVLFADQLYSWHTLFLYTDIIGRTPPCDLACSLKLINNLIYITPWSIYFNCHIINL